MYRMLEIKYFKLSCNFSPLVEYKVKNHNVIESNNIRPKVDILKENLPGILSTKVSGKLRFEIERLVAEKQFVA